MTHSLSQDLWDYYLEHGAKEALDRLTVVSEGKEIENAAIEFIEKLQKRGEDINIASSGKMTLLHIFPHSERVLKAFIRAGGDINLKDDEGKTPLGHFVLQCGLHRNRDFDMLTSDGRNKFYNLFKLYLESGADPNLYPIAWDLGASLSIFNKSTFNPFNKTNADPTYIKRILDLACQYNTDLNKTACDGGVTLLGQIADGYYNTELLREVLKHGADPNVVYIKDRYEEDDWNFDDDEEMTVLCEAIEKGYDTETVELLLEYGANPNCKLYPSGENVCFRNLRSDDETCLEEIKRRATLFHKTPFSFACAFYNYLYLQSDSDMNACENILIALVKSGADINVLDDNEEPAIKLLPEELQDKIKKLVEYRNALDSIQEIEEEMYER